MNKEDEIVKLQLIKKVMTKRIDNIEIHIRKIKDIELWRETCEEIRDILEGVIYLYENGFSLDFPIRAVIEQIREDEAAGLIYKYSDEIIYLLRQWKKEGWEYVLEAEDGTEKY